METCTSCGAPVTFERQNYRYTESGLPNVVLQGLEIAQCEACGNEDVILPFPEKIHWAIARALVAENPARMTGEQLRFLRKHVGFSGDELARHLGTDKTKISKWERGEDPIGKSTDRLVRVAKRFVQKRTRQRKQGHTPTWPPRRRTSATVMWYSRYGEIRKVFWGIYNRIRVDLQL
jgi:putative zinc finger/helix-turn-helix YgiT family protein